MINLNLLLNEAISLASDSHKGQLDKGGKPYIFHPLRVMLKCETVEQQIVAVLHDVVEDCYNRGDEVLFYSMLKHYGYPENIIDAIRAITKNKDEKNNDYWTRVKSSSLATYVKRMDMEDNSSPERLNVLSYGEQEYLSNKYNQLKLFLES
jgi:(p)ppGpp synthase/HD superfamily hydrolase